MKLSFVPDTFKEQVSTYQRILLKLMAKIYGQKDNEDVKGAKFSFSLPLVDDLYNLNKVSHSGSVNSFVKI